MCFDFLTVGGSSILASGSAWLEGWWLEGPIVRRMALEWFSRLYRGSYWRDSVYVNLFARRSWKWNWRILPRVEKERLLWWCARSFDSSQKRNKSITRESISSGLGEAMDATTVTHLARSDKWDRRRRAWHEERPRTCYGSDPNGSRESAKNHQMKYTPAETFAIEDDTRRKVFVARKNSQVQSYQQSDPLAVMEWDNWWRNTELFEEVDSIEGLFDFVTDERFAEHSQWREEARLSSHFNPLSSLSASFPDFQEEMDAE